MPCATAWDQESAADWLSSRCHRRCSARAGPSEREGDLAAPTAKATKSAAKYSVASLCGLLSARPPQRLLIRGAPCRRHWGERQSTCGNRTLGASGARPARSLWRRPATCRWHGDRGGARRKRNSAVRQAVLSRALPAWREDSVVTWRSTVRSGAALDAASPSKADEARRRGRPRRYATRRAVYNRLRLRAGGSLEHTRARRVAESTPREWYERCGSSPPGSSVANRVTLGGRPRRTLPRSPCAKGIKDGRRGTASLAPSRPHECLLSPPTPLSAVTAT
ncbi:hypothetical protein PsYK624_151810 [Phanerochaete sordida]|uniref:Uncharacterized protein n=1 Tax=Phanerochaete sordida TaxID=48140 RepID=A0A9P3GNB5_9APHY|nr:hypothetical protein PsYK624_151810 [Phanerochaete sordida]